MASYPTYDPRVYSGRVTRSELAAAGLTGAAAKADELPGARTARSTASYPAGLDLQAGDRARGDRGAPHLAVRRRSRARGRPARRATRRARCSRTGTRSSTRRWTCRPALAQSRATRTSTSSATTSTAAAEPRAPAPGLGGAVRVRPPDRGRRRRREASGLLPTPEWRQADVHAEDRPDELADRPALEAGRLGPARDRPEGPARHAAADGALLRADRERRQARQAARRSRTSRSRAGRARRRVALRRRRRRSRCGIDPRDARGRPARPLRGDARPYGTSTASSAASRSPIAGKTGTAREGRPAAGLHGLHRPVVVVRLRAGRTASADDRRLRRDRERRLRRRRRRRRRRSRSSSSTSTSQGGDLQTAEHSRLMLESAAHARSGRAAARREASTSRASCARLDWLLLARRRGARRLRALGDHGDHARRHPGRPELLRHAPGGLRGGRRASASSLASLDRPGRLPALGARSTSATARRRCCSCSSAGAVVARLEALDRPRLLPLPAVRVREAAVRPLPRRLPRRPGEARRARRARRSRRSGSRCCRSLLVFLQPDVGTALVYARRARRGALRRRDALAAPRRCSASPRCIAHRSSSGWLPAAGVHILKPYQEQRLTGFTNPTQDPGGPTYNVDAVDRRRRRRAGSPAAASRARRRRTTTSCPSTRPTSSFASLAEQRGFVGASILLAALPARHLARPEDRSRSRATCSRRSSPAGSSIGLLFQIFVNVGMTIGIAPVTGIPLPFVSVGGSAMIANLLAIGFSQAIHARGPGSEPPPAAPSSGCRPGGDLPIPPWKPDEKPRSCC